MSSILSITRLGILLPTSSAAKATRSCLPLRLHLGLARCARQEAPLLRLSVVQAADPRAALRDLSACASETEPEVALRTAAPRAHVPRLAPLPLARRGRLQLRLLARGAISNLKLEAQPTPAALLADSEIELQATGLEIHDAEPSPLPDLHAGELHRSRG